MALAQRKRSSSRAPNYTEEELRLKSQALAAVQDCVAIADASLPEVPVIYVNPAFERVTGYSAAEAAGQHYSFLQGSTSDPVAREKLRIAIQEQRECTVELLNYRKDGKTFLSRIAVTPIRDNQGKVTHFLAVQSDITEQRRVEEALKATDEVLQATYVDMERGTQMARLVQRALLPTKNAEFHGVRFASDVVRCPDLAGDLLNCFPLDEQCLGFYIVDVRAHGVPAALVSVTLSHLLFAPPARSLLYCPLPGVQGRYGISEPVEVVEKLKTDFRIDNQVIRYFTVLYGILNMSNGELRYTSAGQIGMALLPHRSDSTVLDPTGLPACLYPESNYEQKMLKLNAGDRLYLCTDGVMDVLNEAGERFGMEGFLEAIDHSSRRTLDESVIAILDCVRSRCGTKGPEDDASVLALEMTR